MSATHFCGEAYNVSDSSLPKKSRCKEKMKSQNHAGVTKPPPIESDLVILFTYANYQTRLLAKPFLQSFLHTF